ncbi:MAG TPA: thiamine pyrophosphate-dependent enzyme [Terriglobales bacterium]|nr:thiamine pyrophosphate-dependent enzyme [Terriglobales bacterium]
MIESRLWAQSRNLVPVISEATAVAAAAVLHRTDTLAAPADGCTLYPVTHPETRIIPLDLTKIVSACLEARRKRRGAVITICPETIFSSASFRKFLQDAQDRRWPLVCVALTNDFFDARASIPEIDVDGHDAVAMFRVVSESVRRARNQRGPAIIHAHDATKTQVPDPLGDPLIRFERYLAAKGLTTERLHVVHAGQIEEREVGG